MLTTIILFIVLMVIIYQDFKERAIAIWTLPVLLAIGLYFGVEQLDRRTQLQYLLFNFSFIFLQLMVLTLYASWKEKQWVWITKRWLGLGDILFFITMAFYFSPIGFVSFFVMSLLSILLIAILLRNRIQTIPLAGGMSICIILLMCYQWIIHTEKWVYFSLYHF